MSWKDYWDGQTTIYANARHKRVHYEKIAHDIIAFLPGPGACVVDYGCGEALSAHLVADRAARLYLCESAPTTRQRLAERYRDCPGIQAISPEEFAALPAGSIDLIVANSVVQYLSQEDVARLLAQARDKLKPGGRLVLADVIPRDVGMVGDATELLRFAARNGFLLASGLGLVRSFFSSYRRIRQQLGLLQFDEAEMLEVLKGAGFEARRHVPNMGHNRLRMTFVATPSQDETARTAR